MHRPSWGRLGSVQGCSQLCWPWLKIYSLVNAPGNAAPGLVTVPGCGWARPIKAPFIPEASDLAWVQTPGGGLDVELSKAGCRGTHLAETAMLPAPTTPRGLNVTSCHQGASPWGGRDVPRGRTLHGTRFLHLPALPAISRFQALALHFCSPVSLRASDGDARPAQGWADAHCPQESTQVPKPGISYMVHVGELP